LAAAILTAVCASCIGVKSDVTVKSDGSGEIALEYRVNNQFAALGNIDNGYWPALPVGEADFRRGMVKIPGLELKSWSSKQDGDDTVYSAVVAFPSLDALAAFLGAQGGLASYKTDGGAHTLTITLPAEGKKIDPNLAAIVRQSFSGYTLEMNFKLPGKTVPYKKPMADALLAQQPEVITLQW
jgi:hypothetical protein